jgi:hypothetical protein
MWLLCSKAFCGTRILIQKTNYLHGKSNNYEKNTDTKSSHNRLSNGPNP